MDSPQSVVSPCQNSVVSSEHEKQKSDFFTRNSKSNGKDSVPHNNNNNLEPSIGRLHVYIHSARDIHNICIYHKQDVYAKICLTSDPDTTVSTTIINGGGRNPVFNEKLHVDVRTVESSLKCEIWMLSRVRNYLEDQLLGFALVPLSEVLINNGELEKEFSLSSTDLFHSPAGFVQLSLKYEGAAPAVIARANLAVATNVQEDSEIISESPLASELDKIEFPDPKIANEDQIMVSEYFALPGATSLESDDTSSESLVNPGENAVDQHDVVESFNNDESVQAPPTAVNSPPSSVSTTNGVASPSVQASSETSEAPAGAKSPDQEQAKEKAVDGKDSESDSSGGASSDSFTKPVVTVNFEPEQKVVQQEIVDMYMKSMQQFTESLAKMKLPLDIDPTGTSMTPTSNSSSELSSSDPKVQATKNSSSRVFYGSRAFF